MTSVSSRFIAQFYF